MTAENRSLLHQCTCRAFSGAKDCPKHGFARRCAHCGGAGKSGFEGPNPCHRCKGTGTEPKSGSSR